MRNNRASRLAEVYRPNRSGIPEIMEAIKIIRINVFRSERNGVAGKFPAGSVPENFHTFCGGAA